MDCSGPARNALMGLFWQNFFFIIHFYAIMHRTTIVQNKTISIICSSFFCHANNHRPSPGKVWLGRPNPNLSQSLNIYLGRKKIFLFRIECTTMYHCPIFSFHFHIFLKMYHKTCENV